MLYNMSIFCIFTIMKYYTINSMSVQHCQQMLTDNDYMMIVIGKKPLIKSRAKKAYIEFTEELHKLFGGEEDLISAIGKDILIMNIRIRISMLAGLRDSLDWCYSVKSHVKGQIKLLDETKSLYRKIYFDYPKLVDENLSDNDYKDAINSVLKPISNEIIKLQYKVKEISPTKEEKAVKPNENRGIGLHIMFLQSVSPEHFYKEMSVFDFSKAYETAVRKNSKNKQ